MNEGKWEHLSVHRCRWGTGKGATDSQRLATAPGSLPSATSLPPWRVEAEAGLGGWEVRLVRIHREAEQSRTGPKDPFSGALNEHAHSLSQASISNSSALLLCGITFSTSMRDTKTGVGLK